MGYDINLKHLEYFIKVARVGSINKAAQLLYISQPYLGKILHDMEESLGGPLLNRSRQGITLTPEGREFHARAVNILREMDSLRFGNAKEQAASEPLSVSMTKFSHVMESFIAIIKKYQNQPAFTHRLYEGQIDDVIEDVVSRRADVGVIHFDSKRRQEVESMLTSRGLNYHFLSYVEPHIVISKDHPIIRAGLPVTLENLRGYGFIRYMGQYDDLIFRLLGPDSKMGENRIAKEIYVTGRATLMNLITSTDFYSIGIHDFAQQLSAYNAVSVPIAGCELMFEFGYITVDGIPILDVAQEFLREVKKRLANGREA